MPEFKAKAEFNDVYVIQETENALLLNIEDREYWVPKSQIDDDSEVYKSGQSGVLIISEWIAIQKGLV